MYIRPRAGLFGPVSVYKMIWWGIMFICGMVLRGAATFKRSDALSYIL